MHLSKMNLGKDETEKFVNLCKWFTDNGTAIMNATKNYVDVLMQEKRHQEAIARLPLIISELYYVVANYPMPDNYKFDCPDESFIHGRVLTPSLYEIEIPIRNQMQLQPHMQLLFEKAFIRRFITCVRQLQLQCGSDISAYFQILPYITKMKVYQNQPGLIIIRIQLNNTPRI